MNRVISRIHQKLARRRDDRELSSYVRKWLLPPQSGLEDLQTYVPSELIGHAGIDLREQDQLRLLQTWTQELKGLLTRLAQDAKINTNGTSGGPIQNGYYPTPDAEVYASMIAQYRPKRIVEIGAGFSTRIARKIIGEVGLDCELIVVDPEPRTELSDIADRVVRRAVESVPPDEFYVDEQTILFIDSSHIARPRGDIPMLYNTVIPSLPEGALVHIHDVFIPYDYPPIYQNRLYTEQYVLHSLLAHSSRYEVVFATHYMSRAFGGQMQAAFGPAAASRDEHYGSSFWFRIAEGNDKAGRA